MSVNVSALLDKAKVMHRLSSDYKLALVLGVSHVSLTSYRHGKTLPDARAISKICELTGDDPAILAAEIEAERAKTDEARALWSSIARRLSIAAAAGIGAAVLSACGMAADVSKYSNDSSTYAALHGHAQAVKSLYIVQSRRRQLARARRRIRCKVFASKRRLVKGVLNHVFSTPSTAAAVAHA